MEIKFFKLKIIGLIWGNNKKGDLDSKAGKRVFIGIYSIEFFCISFKFETYKFFFKCAYSKKNIKENIFRRIVNWKTYR